MRLILTPSLFNSLFFCFHMILSDSLTAEKIMPSVGSLLDEAANGGGEGVCSYSPMEDPLVSKVLPLESSDPVPNPPEEASEDASFGSLRIESPQPDGTSATILPASRLKVGSKVSTKPRVSVTSVLKDWSSRLFLLMELK